MSRQPTISRQYLFAKTVITGFNTDIEFQGTIYHVQTEDKGVKTPLILSLVYDRGTILASKRSAYNDLLMGEFDEKILAERLQKQHNLICAAIRTGRIEDLKRMAAKEIALKQEAGLQPKTAVVEKAVDKPVKIEPPITNATTNIDPKIRDIEALTKASLQTEKADISANLPIVKEKTVVKEEYFTKPDDEIVWDVPIDIVEEMLVEAVHIIDEDLILSDEAVEIINDSVINGTYGDKKLKVGLLGDIKFKSGDAKTLRILVNRGNSNKGLSGAQIIIKVLGSAFVPLIFHTKTETDGVATVHLQLPQFKSGRAAILIKAIYDGEEVDLRRAIAHG